MKFKILIPVIVFALFTVGCLSSDEESENASKKERTESVEESIDKGLYEQIMEIGGEQLLEGKQGKWLKMKSLIEELSQLESTTNKPLDKSKRKIKKIFKEYGFLTYEAGLAEIEKSGEMVNYTMELGIKIASLQTVELTQSGKELKRAKQNIIKDIKSKGLTQADIQGLEKYESSIGKSISLLFKLPKASDED
ncbi:MAG: hypothetical protein U9N85_06045 [Bacteroidota bacterium]|nr:hypothetical protein [Bacteroidota bacterium]